MSEVLLGKLDDIGMDCLAHTIMRTKSAQKVPRFESESKALGQVCMVETSWIDKR